MSVKVENLEHNMAKITFEVPYERFDKSVNKVYNKQKSRISLPGFRKGKAPRQMIEKMYGAEVFYDEAINDLIPEVYPEAIDESGLDVVSRPVIDFEDIKKGEPIVFTVEVAVRPAIKLPKYEGIEVTKIDTKVTDEDVENELKKEQEKNAREITVDRPVEKGDIAVIDFEGFVDGVAFEGGKGDNYSLEIGSGTFIPGFEDQLIGAKTDDEVEVNVTFPEDYQSEELKGKAVLFKCLVHEIKTRELPEIDDELADDAGFDSLDEFKEDIRRRLTEAREKEAKDKQIDEAMDKIAEAAEVDIPEPMIEYSIDKNFNNFANRIMSSGMNMDQYLQFSGMSEDGMKEQMRPSTITQIRTTLALDAIAAEQGFTATDEDIEAEIEKMAKMYGMEIEELKKIMPERELDTMKDEIAANKAMDYVFEHRKEVAPKKEKKKKEDKADKEKEEDKEEQS